MTSRGPFQPKTFYDSMILWLWSYCSYLFVWIAASPRNARLEGASRVIVSNLLQSQVTVCETRSLGACKDHLVALRASTYQGP